MDINNLIYQYSKASIELDGIYIAKVESGSKALGMNTMEGVCGFVIPIKGTATYSLCDEKVHLKQGIILHAGSGMPLDKVVTSDEPWEYVLVHYRVDGEEHKNYFHNLKYTLNIGTNQYKEIVKMLIQMHENEKSGSIINTLQNKVLLYTLLEIFMRYGKEKSLNCEEEKIKYITTFIHSNLDKNFTVQELANMVHMDCKRFCYIFQKIMGMNPKRYITKCTIKHAKELLVKEQYSISEVANILGYEDPFYFSRIFKKNTGVAPSYYREGLEKNP